MLITKALNGEKLSIGDIAVVKELMQKNMAEYEMKGEYQICCYSAMLAFFQTAYCILTQKIDFIIKHIDMIADLDDELESIQLYESSEPIDAINVDWHSSNRINSGDIAPYIFIYNILGNAVALMPFAFFLPILLKKQKKFKNFLVTMICIVIGIELLQFITMSGCCDIDDVILNVVGAVVMFGILRIKSINQLIRNIFLLEKNKIDYKDLVKKIIIILIPIICIIGVVFISENKYIDKNSQTFTHLKIIDKTKEENIACNTALEQFYEDKEYIYYFPCEKSKYVIVIYSNGYQETVKSSLEYGDITIEDLERNNIEFIKQKKDMSN